MSREPLPTNFKRRWYQFSLRSLLLFVTLCAIPCSWLAVKIEHGKRQRAAVAALEAKGIGVGYGYELGPDGKPLSKATLNVPQWLRRLLGDDCFATVVGADIIWESRGTWVFNPWFGRTDEDLRPLLQLPHLRFLDLGGAQIGDSALKQLTELSDLERLNLGGAKITDAGLSVLKAFPKLRILNLGDTAVGDDGMTQLLFLKNLEELDLTHTNVTDRGLLVLQKLTALKRLALAHDLIGALDISPAEHVRVDEAQHTTDTGVAKLEKLLPNCQIER